VRTPRSTAGSLQFPSHLVPPSPLRVTCVDVPRQRPRNEGHLPSASERRRPLSGVVAVADTSLVVSWAQRAPRPAASARPALRARSQRSAASRPAGRREGRGIGHLILETRIRPVRETDERGPSLSAGTDHR
jgi:hypothetical protein